MARYKILKVPADATVKPGGGSYHGGNTPEIKVNETLQPTSRKNANLEAEKGETVVTNLQGEGIPEFYKISGKPHSKGGTPLNLPPASFIFSDDKKLSISDPEVLAMFGKSSKSKKFTPANLSKTYNLNKYREILVNPFTDEMQRETAEKMIQNYNLKLGALALAQESKKGFEDGIPAITVPYMEYAGINPGDLLSPNEAPTPEQLSEIAKYGVETYGNGGQPKKRKVKVTGVPGYPMGGAIPYYQGGGEAPKTSGKATKRQNIPKNAVLWDPEAEGYDRSQVRSGDYIKNKSGRWEKVTGFKRPEYTGDFSDPQLGDFQTDYGLLQDKFQDPKLRKAFVDQYRKEIISAKPNPRTKLTQADIDQAVAMSDEEIINLFLNKNKVNFAINAQFGDLSEHDKNDLWDKNPDLANQTAQKLGYQPLDRSQIAAFQAAYIGINNLAHNPKHKEMFKDFNVTQVGRPDEQIMGVETGSISQIDGWDGNTTSAQVMLPRDSVMQTADVEDVTVKRQPEQTIEHLPEGSPEEYNPFWTQDLLEVTGRFGDLMGIKKYDPWQAPLAFETATPHFTDFRGTAARIGSTATAGAQQAATFADPQNFAAMFANIQKGATDPILKAQEAEYRGNQAIANQFEMFNVGNKLRHNARKQALDSQLHDKSVIANQQFDNAKRGAKHALRTAVANALTNRGKTQTMNSLRDDFAVDPVTGFTYKKFNSRPILPGSGQQTSIADSIADLKSQYPDMSWEDATRIAKINKGLSSEDSSMGVNPAAYQYPQ